MATSSPAPIIYINALPGTGKLTIARALQPLIPNSTLIDNHQLIDPVERLTPRTHHLYQHHRGKYRRSILGPIADDPKLKNKIYIFTDSQTEHNECMGDYTDLALSCNGNGGRRFYSVVLECELEENVRRLTMAGRGGGLNGKLTDPEVLREVRNRGEGPWKFGDSDESMLDVTKLSPMEAAKKIKAFFEKRQREGRDRSEMDEL